MPSALITAKGQTTIPKAIRERLRVEPDDWIDFVVRPTARCESNPPSRE